MSHGWTRIHTDEEVWRRIEIVLNDENSSTSFYALPKQKIRVHLCPSVANVSSAFSSLPFHLCLFICVYLRSSAAKFPSQRIKTSSSTNFEPK